MVSSITPHRGSKALSLMEGLLHRSPETHTLVQQAFQYWKAQTRIQQWLAKKYKLQCADAFPLSQSHWLFQALSRTICLDERHVACQMVLQGCRRNAFETWQLLDLLVCLLEQTHDWTWIALLQHVLLNSPDLSSSFWHLRLPFLCRRLWHPNTTTTTAWIEWMYQVTLCGYDESVYEKLWNAPPSPHLTPLACLIGAQMEQQQQQGSQNASLSQLLDPAVTPTLSKRDSSNDSGLYWISSFHVTTTTTSNSSAKPTTTSNTTTKPPESQDRSAAAAVARIFSAVYGDSKESEEDEEDIILEDADDHEEEEEDDHDHEEEEEEEDEVEEEEEEVEEEEEEEDDDEAADEEEEEEEEEEHAQEQPAAETTTTTTTTATQEQLPQSTLTQNDDEEEEEEEEDDEEIDSDEVEDEDCGDNEVDEEEEEEEEHDIVIHDDDVARLEEGLLEVQEDIPAEEEGSLPRGVQDRKRAFLRASMEVLAVQHPLLRPRNSAPLSLQAEHALMTSIMNIVKPPKKPVNSKIILRRAPTQEEFFRGSLSKNPVSLSMLQSRGARREGNEPSVRDLRQHIDNDLQMGDSAELLELLVANKIVDVDLKLRVVHQVLWKTHLMENSTSTSLSSFLGSSSRAGGAPSFFSTGSGLSMIFSSGFDRRGTSRNITADTPLSALPPMVVTYRLTGVDGEATEDTVTTLEDPEAPSESATPEQVEKLMEKEYGITRLVTQGRGVFCILRSVEQHIMDTLRRIRRDEVDCVSKSHNPSRAKFKQAPPYPGLMLLWCCSKLPSNRKILLQCRAPTVLLRLLLDVLHALEEGQQKVESESNATAKVLQELIEVLASDISTGTMSSEESEQDAEKDASTLRLLLSSIETTSLSRPLRNVIAKLLPYLTYGQASLSKELALDFARHVSIDYLSDCDDDDAAVMKATHRSVLMDTFVHASMSLPANEVCNSLRLELINCGFIERIAKFLLRGVPLEPPPWSASLWAKDEPVADPSTLERKWKEYFQRPGLKTAFDMLIGLCKKHGPTQAYLLNFDGFLRACHWIESTSDNTGARISMNGLGLVAETLLDELSEANPVVGKQVLAVRRKTRDRKKEIAMARRNKTLVSMSSFGPLAGSATNAEASKVTTAEEGTAPSTSVRGTAASILAPVLGLFRDSSANAAVSNDSTSGPAAKRRKKDKTSPKPAWMAEMESMEDEKGLTCAVCQEGRTLQPSELLGLYAYVKKVSIAFNQCGGRTNIDGTALLTALPSSLPESLTDSHAAEEWYPPGKAAGDELRDSSRASMASSVASNRRATYFTTTVSAGNAIHCSCHTKARQADRSHPKAPKSEWEGASLRNSRVNCNVILPLVSSRSSKVPLVAVDVALTDHQTAISNLLGARPKSMLWTVLHDVRLLLLRMAYGEALNSDCGGGSLVSNAQLVFYQMLMGDMFEKDAQVDAPETAQHARNLSAGFLAACSIVRADGYDAVNSTSLLRGISDSAPMAALTCILFHNSKDDFSSSSAESSEDEEPHPKRRWVTGKDLFLRGLLNCAGRRHALGIDNSGCLTGRNTSQKRNRSTAFADWEVLDEDDVAPESSFPSSASRESAMKRNSKPGIDDFRDALRPMIVYYAIMDQLSSEFVLHMDDAKVEESANRMVEVIDGCQRAKSIHELLRKAKVTLAQDDIIDELQKGMISA